MVFDRRNGIYRCIIVAAFGWLSLAAGPAPDNANSAKQADTAQSVERSLNSIATAQDKISKATDAGEYEAPCRDGEYNNQSDLCAQWYAARAARDAADWAWWALAVGIVGALGIVAALALTIDSNRIARDTAKRQLRAYVQITPKAGPTRSGLAISHASLVAENYGQTPAGSVQIETAHFISDKEPLPDESPNEIWVMAGSNGVMHPSQKDMSFAHNIRITNAEAREVINKARFLYILARITYVDVFQCDHIEQVCWFLGWESSWPVNHPARFILAHRYNLST